MPSEIPATTNTVGRQCTRGDEVVSALGNLLKKMELLEQNRRAAHELASQDLKEHIELVESQCSLLEKQLRHARKMLALSTTLRSSPYLERDDYASTVRSRHRSTSLSQASSSSAFTQCTTPNEVASCDKVSRSSQTNSMGRRRSASETRSDKVNCIAADRYRLNLADIPFILSKSAGPSHSLPANLQNLVSLLKKSQPTKQSSKSASGHSKGLRRHRSDSNVHTDVDDGELLDLVLQGEELLKQMERKRPQSSRHSLKCKARWLVKHIEDKLTSQDTVQHVFLRQEMPPVRQGCRRRINLPSRKPSDGNRLFFRELKRIQRSLEEQL